MRKKAHPIYNGCRRIIYTHRLQREVKKEKGKKKKGRKGGKKEGKEGGRKKDGGRECKLKDTKIFNSQGQ